MWSFATSTKQPASTPTTRRSPLKMTAWREFSCNGTIRFAIFRCKCIKSSPTCKSISLRNVPSKPSRRPTSKSWRNFKRSGWQPTKSQKSRVTLFKVFLAWRLSSLVSLVFSKQSRKLNKFFYRLQQDQIFERRNFLGIAGFADCFADIKWVHWRHVQDERSNQRFDQKT